MQIKEMLYEGKAKKIFKTDNDHILVMEFKDSLTAFNAQKKGEFSGKGELNCKISTIIFKLLTKHGVKHHWIETKDSKFMVVHQTKIIPLEVVVRNFLAGSLAKKLSMEEGKQLNFPIVEFYYKSDELNDPFMNDDQILALGMAEPEDLKILKSQALNVNNILVQLFESIGMKLIDFKIEFGFNSVGKIILADEITPDCMRLWDSKTNEKLDKDRFRRDLGSIDSAYKEVYDRLKLGVQL